MCPCVCSRSALKTFSFTRLEHVPSLYVCRLHPQPLTAAERAGSGGWLLDPDPAAVASPRCTVTRVHAARLSQERFDAEFWQRQPVLIDGLMENWPAFERWTRAQLHAGQLGRSVVAAGDGANIVQSGGRSGAAATSLAAYLDQMANLTTSRARGDAARRRPLAESEDDDVFNFDPDFLEAMPELANDFHVPALFHRWAGAGKRSVSVDPRSPLARNPAWSMLSLGASRSGLPWHVHGDTWLGLVFGQKRWLLYEPSGEAPLKVRAQTTFPQPLMGAYAWLRDVYPLVRAAVAEDVAAAAALAASASAAAPASASAAAAFTAPGARPPLRDGSSGGLPLECVQKPGEVLYLPSGWKHLTVNVGEAIGVGGQVCVFRRACFFAGASFLRLFFLFFCFYIQTPSLPAQAKICLFKQRRCGCTLLPPAALVAGALLWLPGLRFIRPRTTTRSVSPTAWPRSN